MSSTLVNGDRSTNRPSRRRCRCRRRCRRRRRRRPLKRNTTTKRVCQNTCFKKQTELFLVAREFWDKAATIGHAYACYA